MANYGWRHGITTKEKPMGKNTNKVLQQVAQGLDTMQVFQQVRCTSPTGCAQPAIVLSAMLIGDAIAIGAYCIDHMSLIEVMLKSVRR